MFIAINANRMAGEMNTSMIAHFETFEDAKNCCLTNMAEDFGYEDVDAFMDRCGLDFIKGDCHNPMYEIRKDDNDGHEEIYKVYEIK